MIRSYLLTLREQSANLFTSLALTFQGSPPMPRLGQSGGACPKPVSAT